MLGVSAGLGYYILDTRDRLAYSELMAMVRDSTFSFVPGRSRASVQEHEELLRLIETNAAPLEIELAARAHRTATLDAMLAYQAEHKHQPESRSAAEAPASSPGTQRASLSTY